MTSVKSNSIIIATHYLLYGAAQALRDYLLKKKIVSLCYIALPLVSQRQVFTISYINGKKTKEKIISRGDIHPLLDYFLDFLLIISFVYSQRKYDIFIGVDGLNCLAGLFLKRIGKVKKVIFYSIDFVPIRFTNKLLNTIYHKIEIYCVKHADESWNVSPRIAEGREKFLEIKENDHPQKVVPIGVWNKNIILRPFSKVKKHQILFLGHLLEKQGVQLVIEAIPSIIKKIPDFHFVIVGGGEYEDQLKELVSDLKLKNYVTFTGWVKDRSVIDAMMSESAVAVATYKPEEEKLYNFTYYADPTKLKDYLSAGLPIILTDISYNSKEIAEKKCGILVEYTKEGIAKAIVKLLSNKNILKKYRENALRYAQTFDWNVIFKKVII